MVSIGLRSFGQAAQIRKERVGVGATDLGVIGIRKCGVQHAALFGAAMVERAPEVFCRPVTKPCGRIGCEIAGKHGAKRRVDATPSCPRHATAGGVTSHAVACARKVGATRDLGAVRSGNRWDGCGQPARWG